MNSDSGTALISGGLGLCIAFVLALGSMTGANAQSPGKLSVSVGGVRSDNGSVRCGLIRRRMVSAYRGAKCVARSRA